MNNISWMICALTALVVPFLPTTAAADEPKQSRVSSSPQKQYSVRLGMGGLLKTKYPGSQDYIMSPYPIIIVDRLFVPGIGQVVDVSRPPKTVPLFG